MTLTTTRPGPVRDAALPWPALVTLGAATLVMVTAEMLPTAVLVPMSRGLEVSESATGHLVALWALTVVVVSIPLTHLFRGIDRRTLLVAGLVTLAASSLLTAGAASFGAALAARLLGAGAVGLLWATANAHVADLVRDELLGRAIAVVLGGATLGLVLGTPLARLVADQLGWRASFVVLAAVALGIAVLVRTLVPGRPRRPRTPGHRTDPGRPRLTPTVTVTALVGAVLVGFYGAYTFITRLGEHAAALLPGRMSTLLLGFGLASVAGVALAGRVAARTAVGLVVAAGATSVTLLALTWAERPAAGLVTILALGLVSGALPPLAQTEILRLAGPHHRDLAAALIPVVFNGGIALGAAAASVLVGRSGHTVLPLPSAVVVAVATLGLGIVAARRPRNPAPRRAAAPAPSSRLGISGAADASRSYIRRTDESHEETS